MQVILMNDEIQLMMAQIQDIGSERDKLDDKLKSLKIELISEMQKLSVKHLKFDENKATIYYRDFCSIKKGMTIDDVESEFPELVVSKPKLDSTKNVLAEVETMDVEQKDKLSEFINITSTPSVRITAVKIEKKQLVIENKTSKNSNVIDW